MTAVDILDALAADLELLNVEDRAAILSALSKHCQRYLVNMAGELAARGESLRSIAATLGCSPETARSWVARAS